MKNLLKPISIIIAFILLLVGIQYLPIIDQLREWLKSFESDGLAMVQYTLVGILLTLCFSPVSIVISGAGFVFGWLWGFCVSSMVLIGGLSLGFWLGRWLWPKISNWKIFDKEIFKALQKAIETEGSMLITFLRMTPFFHFMTGNLFFGSLKLNFWKYLLFSYLGTIPGTLLVVYAGHLAASSISEKEGLGIWNTVFFIVGAILMLGLSYRITHVTRKIMNQSGEESKD